MKRLISLVEARKLYGDYCLETTTSFTIKYGGSEPDLYYVMDKIHEVDDQGSPKDKIYYIIDRNITDRMNLIWHGGKVDFLPGEFIRSKDFGNCFRIIDDISRARHLLIRVSRKFNGDYTSAQEICAKYGALFFQKSNGTYEYCVLPVGYYRYIHDEAIDGTVKYNAAVAASYEKQKQELIAAGWHPYRPQE